MKCNVIAISVLFLSVGCVSTSVKIGDEEKVVRGFVGSFEDTFVYSTETHVVVEHGDHIDRYDHMKYRFPNACPRSIYDTSDPECNLPPLKSIPPELGWIIDSGRFVGGWTSDRKPHLFGERDLHSRATHVPWIGDAELVYVRREGSDRLTVSVDSDHSGYIGYIHSKEVKAGLRLGGPAQMVVKRGDLVDLESEDILVPNVDEFMVKLLDRETILIRRKSRTEVVRIGGWKMEIGEEFEHGLALPSGFSITTEESVVWIDRTGRPTYHEKPAGYCIAISRDEILCAEEEAVSLNGHEVGNLSIGPVRKIAFANGRFILIARDAFQRLTVER